MSGISLLCNLLYVTLLKHESKIEITIYICYTLSLDKLKTRLQKIH